MTHGAASPYATGGGGVRLEHRYAATLVAALLAEDPVGELGDGVVPLGVRLQASDISPVDDVVVEGRSADGRMRRVSIGVRRDPELTAGDEKSVPLVRSFLRVVTGHWDEVAAGRWRVALAVGVSGTAVRQTDALARIAQSVSSAARFREAVARPGAANAAVRRRLTHLDALVGAAAAGDPVLSGADARELTWRWLSALRVRQLRLEGVDETDRTTAVSALRRMVADGAVETADAVFGALAERAGAWASSAAHLDMPLVRRALSGFPLGRAASCHQAWSVLDAMARRLREGTRPDLRAGEVRLELDRAGERARLADAMVRTGRTGAGLVVTGEPDVGKSALTVRTARQLTEDGAAVACLSLRDLPASVVETEHVLGGRPLAEVFTAGEVRPVRLLVVDGAEAVLEGRRDLLREVAVAAFRAGLGVVAVTRSDGAARVHEVLETATAQAGGTGAVTRYVVARLTLAERRRLVDTFRPLIRLSADPRAEWLVGRPGLVDVLLRAGTVHESSGLLSEADVFAAVWNGLVRNGEEHPPGAASPDEREQAVLAVARRALGLPGEAPAGALPGLRSDAVLRAPANPAFAAGDEFATDLIRDFALCRLFLTTGWDPLRTAGAPRWTMRAVRLACQAKLLSGDQAAVWRDLDREFGRLGEEMGERWTEVPAEALLTLGDAQTAIEHVWDDLAADGHRGLRTLLRLADLRYVSDSVADPFTLASVVASAYCTDRDLGQHDPSARGGLGESVRTLVLAWLRGMARDTEGTDPLRRRVRDRLLAAPRDRHDEFAVEALATLGPDTDEHCEQWLREVAAAAPGRLHAAVESLGAVFLARTHSRLLLDLTEAYYLHRPEPGRRGGGAARDDGIRRHRHRPAFGPPFAAWHLGPFFWLLREAPVDTVALINRMLDHAATVRVGAHRQPGTGADAPAAPPAGVDIDLPGIGPRRYVGDGQVWSWYRGSTAGPYPCMSALMAVERYVDQLAAADVPLPAIVGLLLDRCHNLAMAGLVVGLLVRHLQSAGDLLDAWLTAPAVWRLESTRAAGEVQALARWTGPDEAFGADRRGWTLRDAAAALTVRAVAARDRQRLDTLAGVADRLVATARAGVGGGPGDRLLVVQGWASVLRHENFSARRAADGSLVWQYEPPAPVAEALAPTAAALAAGGEALRLAHTYTDRDGHPGGWPADALLADLARARRFAADPPSRTPLDPQDAPAAVAAAAVTSHARGLTTVPDDDLRWAADTLLTAAETPPAGADAAEAWVSPTSAARSAAHAVPVLLLAPFDHLGIAPDRIEEAVTALVTRSDALRTALATDSAPVWDAPCAETHDGTPCRRHGPLWSAVGTVLGHCRLGPWDRAAQRRHPRFLPPPHHRTLPAVPPADLLVNRLALPLACTAHARTTACLAAPAAALLPVLTDAHRHGCAHWAAKGYDGYRAPERELVVRTLVTLAAQGSPEPLTAHLRTFAANANALQQLLHDAATLFTYESRLRALLPTVWPYLLGTTLEALDAGAGPRLHGPWSDYAIAALLPTPQLRTADLSPDDTLHRARRDWIPPEALAGLAGRWLVLARGEPKAADALARFARTTPRTWQSVTGLTWLERLVDGRYDAFADRCPHLTHWLTELRETPLPDATALDRWRRVVDGLAAAGDRQAAALQRIDE
ncbi:hypothetical protein ACH4PW_18570 [Streptomyces sp. NPDC017082]|uniref:hypothetical protein n=1 Tax=Streptomyces sp. NPDC017082 TaxID=3364974 RepID=UPI0037BA244B